MKTNTKELIISVIALACLGFVLAHILMSNQTSPASVAQNPDVTAPQPADSISTTTTDNQEPIESPEEPTFCTLDAKMCPDGSFVGRTGPNCEFAACPAEEPANEPIADSVMCTEEMKQAEACIEIYAPVCGLVDVQCVTTPCDRVPETFSNGCFACAQGNVSSYTEGMCEAS